MVISLATHLNSAGLVFGGTSCTNVPERIHCRCCRSQIVCTLFCYLYIFQYTPGMYMYISHGTCPVLQCGHRINPRLRLRSHPLACFLSTLRAVSSYSSLAAVFLALHRLHPTFNVLSSCSSSKTKQRVLSSKYLVSQYKQVTSQFLGV